MRAARMFAEDLRDSGLLEQTASVQAELFGSLGATGRGHGSDKAVILGLQGETPEGVDVGAIPDIVRKTKESGRLPLLGQREIDFRPAEHLSFLRQSLPYHPNGLRFTALDARGNSIR